MKALLIALLVFSPFTVSAALLPTLDSALELTATPTYPSPGDSVIIRARNFDQSFGTPTFTWRVNGQVVDQGIGRDTITTNVGGEGSSVRVSVTAISGSKTEERSLILRPATVDIVWEAQTNNIPFVLHRPLPNGESLITFYAVPNIVQDGGRVASGNLLYTWYVNGSQVPVLSGTGEQVLEITPPQFENPFTVAVIAQTGDQTIQAQKLIRVVPTQPSVTVYEDAPLLGMLFSRAVMEQASLTEEEITLFGFPLGVHNQDGLTYQWRVNGSTVSQTGTAPRELTLRREGGGSGQARLEFSFTQPLSLFEKAAKSFLVEF